MVFLKYDWCYVEEIARSCFSTLPRGLRGSALEIESVKFGSKPACLLALDEVDLPNAIAWIQGRGLAIVAAPHPTGPSSYAQGSGASRQAMIERDRFRVYVAKEMSVAQRIANLELFERDMSELGRELGYPNCCVKFASKNDRAKLDNESGLIRLSNLNVAAVKNSSGLDHNCNRFLSESWLSSLAPTSAIPHYPCSLDCHDSAGIGRLALELCVRTWPAWGIVLGELLSSPTMYWDDTEWSSDYWNEYCGFILPTRDATYTGCWEAPFPSRQLNGARDPFNQMPKDTIRIQCITDSFLLKDKDSHYTIIDQRLGAVWLLEWLNGRVWP